MNDLTPLWLSLRVAVVATAIASTTGITLAYFLAKTRFRLRSLVEAIVTLPIVLPPTVLGYYLLTLLGVTSPVGRAWQNVFGHPLVFTETAAVVAASVSALPFCVRTARAAIEGVDPRVEAAARVMGMREWNVARRVTLPLARHGIGAAIALSFARALGDFGATVMIAGNIPHRTQTLPVAVYDAVQSGDSAFARTGAATLAAIAIVVLLGVNHISNEPHRQRT
jgi:molybdate transport system permease protein